MPFLQIYYFLANKANIKRIYLMNNLRLGMLYTLLGDNMYIVPLKKASIVTAKFSINRAYLSNIFHKITISHKKSCLIAGAGFS